MYNKHIQLEKPKGLLPGVKVSFISPYTGWISVYSFKQVIQVLYFKYRGSEVSFYRKRYNEAKSSIQLVKRVVEQSIVNTLNLLRKKFFQQNIDIKAQGIFGRVFFQSSNGGVQIQSESRGEFVPLPQASLYREVIEESASDDVYDQFSVPTGKPCSPSYAAVDTTFRRNGTYLLVARFTLTRNTYQIEGIPRECYLEILERLKACTESEVLDVLKECEQIKADSLRDLDKESAKAMADIFV